MNIWLMNHYATDMYREKAGRHHWFAKLLAQRGHTVTIFCASTYHTTSNAIDMGDSLHRSEAVGDVTYVFVRTTPSVGNGVDRIRNMGLFYKNLFPATAAYIQSNGKPDIIIASSVHPLTLVAGIKIAKKLGIPCICEIRDLWPEAIFAFKGVSPSSITGQALTRGEHWIYRHADALIFTKEGDVDYIKEQGWAMEQGGDIPLSKCHYINNGVNLSDYHKQIQEETLEDESLSDPDAFNVIYAGIIRPVNNVGMILDAAKMLKSERDIRFLIYGDGSELPALGQRIASEQIDNVQLKGIVARRHIPYVLSRSSVNLLNYSQRQINWSRGNSSNKLFEYMASGKPIISTVRMGYSLIARYGCGIELEACNAQALADAILQVRDLSPEAYEQMGAQALLAAQDFDFEKLTDRLLGVIDSVLAGSAV